MNSNKDYQTEQLIICGLIYLFEHYSFVTEFLTNFDIEFCNFWYFTNFSFFSFCTFRWVSFQRWVKGKLKAILYFKMRFWATEILGFKKLRKCGDKFQSLKIEISYPKLMSVEKFNICTSTFQLLVIFIYQL